MNQQQCINFLTQQLQLLTLITQNGQGRVDHEDIEGNIKENVKEMFENSVKQIR